MLISHYWHTLWGKTNAISFHSCILSKEEKANWIKQGFKRELTAKLTAKLRVELFDSIVEIRVQNFLTSQSLLLKMIPPTHGAFLQHLKRVTYATIVDKTAHMQ